MTSGRMTLTTQKLDFFREKNYAYYDNGATIVDPSFRLVSRIGYYYPASKKAIFKGNVDLNGTDYRITTDTLTYNSRTSEGDGTFENIPRFFHYQFQPGLYE